MKKTLTILILIVLMILLHLIQVTVFRKWTMFGVLANIVIVYFIFLSTYTNKILAYILAFSYGFMVDIKYASPIGTTAFALIILIEITVRLNLLLYINSRIATMIKVFLLTVIFEFVKYLLRLIILSFDIEILEFLKIVAIQATFNMLILMVIYPLFKYSGELINEIYNKKNILTRYF